jgi:hypothetical protein
MRQLDLMDDKNALTERGLQIQAAALRQGKK